jgi:hypothetical protein
MDLEGFLQVRLQLLVDADVVRGIAAEQRRLRIRPRSWPPAAAEELLRHVDMRWTAPGDPWLTM